MFRLLGFEVRVRTGFVIFVALIVFLYQDAFGLWLAGALTVFTLLHELGHAVAARSAGAEASISLDFLAGYTSFRPDPNRPIGRGRRAVISAAGPATQIVVSVAVLLALGVDPTSRESALTSAEAYAIWWAGPVIGVLNLIPVLPLDGGHLALTALQGPLGERAMRTMAIASLVVTSAGAVLLFLTGNAGFGIFVAFLLLNQFQIVQATSPGSRARRAAVSRSGDAESQAWQTGRPGMLEPGQRLSPWYEAHRALTAGDAGGAMGVILADLRSPGPPRWTPPLAATPEQLRAIVSVLPADLPDAGNPYSARVLTEILLGVGQVQRAGEYAARAYGIHHHWSLATIVARASGALGEQENARRWLVAAADGVERDVEPARRALGRIIDAAPELAAVRADPEVAAIRGRLTRP